MAGKLGAMKIETKPRKLVARGTVHCLELWVPAEARDPFSRVFQFSFRTGLRFKERGMAEDYYEARSGAYLSSVALEYARGVDVSIYDLGLRMLNRHLLGPEEREAEVENLLSPSRLSLAF